RLRRADHRRLPAPLRRRPGDRGGAPAVGAHRRSTRLRADRDTRVRFCGLELAHPIINASGTFDAIAARRAFGDALLRAFPFSAFVSKTVTVAPREGNPPPRLWELPAGLMN